MIKIETVKVLGLLIRKTRKEQGLTQEKLAAACGSGIRFLRELENGKESCHIGKVLHIVHMLGIELHAKRRGEL